MSEPVRLAPEHRARVLTLLNEISEGFTDCYDELPKSVVEDDETRGEQLSDGFRKPFGELCTLFGITGHDLMKEDQRPK